MPDDLHADDPHAEEQRAAMARDGAVVVRALLDEAWCARLRSSIERCRDAPGPHYGVLSPPASPLVDSDLFRWGDDPDLYDLTHASPLVDRAAGLLDVDEVVLIEDQWFASAPGATTPSPWHQDEPYYRLDRPFLTIWITLDDIGEDASLRVVTGSHVTGVTYAPVEFSATSTTIGAGSAYEPVPDIDADPGRFAMRSWSLRAGDAIALDSRTLHATGRVALSGAFRRISTRWAAPGTRYAWRGAGAATFWDELPHGLGDGDVIAGDIFPLVTAGERRVHAAETVPTRGARRAT